MKFIVLLLFVTEAFAQDCGNRRMKQKLSHYDSFIKGLPKSKDMVRDVNRYIIKYGLLIDVMLTAGGLESYPYHVSGDDIIGAKQVFIKRFVESRGLILDETYEIETQDSLKTQTEWQIPSNRNIEGVMGNEVIVRTFLGSQCFPGSKEILIAINPKGVFRAIPMEELPEIKPVPCPITKTFYKDSDFGSCQEIIDLKTKKKRYFLLQYPIT